MGAHQKSSVLVSLLSSAALYSALERQSLKGYRQEIQTALRKVLRILGKSVADPREKCCGSKGKVLRIRGKSVADPREKCCGSEGKVMRIRGKSDADPRENNLDLDPRFC